MLYGFNPSLLNILERVMRVVPLCWFLSTIAIRNNVYQNKFYQQMHNCKENDVPSKLDTLGKLVTHHLRANFRWWAYASSEFYAQRNAVKFPQRLHELLYAGHI